MMLAECSSVGLTIDLAAIPRPDAAPLDRWLQTFPSFGYILSVPPDNAPAVIARFAERGIHAADIGVVTARHDRARHTRAPKPKPSGTSPANPLLGCTHA